MNLPNKLTLLRCLLVPVFMFFVQTSVFATQNPLFGGYSMLIALFVFAIASFTDFLDGYLARRDNLVTDFGKFMDPLADKVLTTAALIYFVKFGLCSSIVLILILTREFAVSGIRMVAASSGGGKVIAASIWGKAKTVLQMITLILGLLFLSLQEMGVLTNLYLNNNLTFAVNISMWVVALVTVISGLQYIIPNIDLIKNAK